MRKNSCVFANHMNFLRCKLGVFLSLYEAKIWRSPNDCHFLHSRGNYWSGLTVLQAAGFRKPWGKERVLE